jgi:hypothetical protein
MAAATGTLLGIGAGLGALGGAVTGARGSGGMQQTTSFGAAGRDERKLQRQSMDQYLQSLQQLQQDQNYINQTDPLRQQALGIYQQGLDGSLTASPQQLEAINQVRNAQIQLGTQGLEEQLGQRLRQTAGSAGVRGLRGQALAELQGQNLQMIGREVGNITNQAGLQAAQQAYLAPQQQMNYAQQGMTYADQLRQQAFNNRQLAANPALLGMYQRERMGASTVSSPSQGGGFWGGLGGALAGAGSGFGGVANAAGALRGLGSGGGGMTNAFGGQIPGQIVE